VELWSSAEIHEPATEGWWRTWRCVDPYLNAAFASSSLSSLAIKIRYIPIVMPEGMRERYPARSNLRKKQRLYDCAPQLDYKVFVAGSFADQLREYLRGIALSAPHLAALGASASQVAEFKAILAGAAARILEQELPDQTRH
jgi:hypothetical protein